MSCPKYKLGSEPTIILIVYDPVTRQPLNISSATSLELIFKTGVAAPVTKVGAFTTDGTDGKMQYAVVGEEFGTGKWKVEGHAIMGPGDKDVYTTTSEFEIIPRLT